MLSMTLACRSLLVAAWFIVAVASARAQESCEFCYADCDKSTGESVLDIFDFLCFQNSFVNGESYACECDTSTGLGVCDIFDFLCFQDAFVNGCPEPSITNPPATQVGQHSPISTACESLSKPGMPPNLLANVYLHSGEFVLRNEVDFRIPGIGIDVPWQRFYRSGDKSSGLWGPGWTGAFEVLVTEGTGGVLELQNGTGRMDCYTLQSNGTYVNSAIPRVITRLPNGEIVARHADAGEWYFHPLGGGPSEGKLREIIDRNGNKMSLSYDGIGRLVAIQDTLGRDYSIGYNNASLIIWIEDFTGRRYTYQYYGQNDPCGAPGQLKSRTTTAVTNFPQGKTRTYCYEVIPGGAGPIIEVRNGRGEVILSPEYDSNGRVETLGVGEPGLRHFFRYDEVAPTPKSNMAVRRTVWIDPEGNGNIMFFDQRNRCVQLREMNGRYDTQLPVPLAPPHPKVNPEDPDDWVTEWAWNFNSLPKRVDHPESNWEVLTYDAKSTSHISRFNLIRHGRFPGLRGANHPVLVDEYEYLPNLSGSCCGTSFVKEHIDPDGEITENFFDPSGNKIRTVHPIPTIEEQWTYNVFGQVTSHTLPRDENGYRLTTAYAYYTDSPRSNGFLKFQTIAPQILDLKTTYSYTPRGLLEAVTDPNGNSTFTEYNQLDQVVSESSRTVVTPAGPLQYVRQSIYDENDAVIEIHVQNIDDLGNLQNNEFFTTTFEVNSLNLTTSVTQETAVGESFTTRYSRNANYDIVAVQLGESVNGNSPRNTITHVLNERRLPFRTTRAAGSKLQSTDEFWYDGDRNKIVHKQGIEKDPRITRYTYDGFSRLWLSVDPMGNMVSRTYDADGLVAAERLDGERVDVRGSSKNVRLREVVYRRDKMDRVVAEREAFFDTKQTLLQGGSELGWSITTKVWNDASKLIRMVNDNRHEAVRSYDEAHRLKLATDHAGNSIEHTYDDNSNIIEKRETDKSDVPGEPDQTFITTMTYDGKDRLFSRTDSSGNVTAFAYDSRDNPTLEVDAQAVELRRIFDGAGRLTATIRDMNANGAKVFEPADIVTRKAWDASSRLTRQIDDNGKATEYVYDALNRIYIINVADCTLKLLTHDTHDNVVSWIDANGTQVDSLFDHNNRVNRRDVVAFGGGVAKTTTFEEYLWDGRSRLVEGKNNSSIVEREYDSLSNISLDALNSVPTTSVYDGVGNVLSITYPGGRVVDSTFDVLERAERISDSLVGKIASYNYVGPSRVHRKMFGNGVQEEFTYDGISGVPNPAGDAGVKRITETQHWIPATGAVVDYRTYRWDQTQNKVQRQDIRPGGAGLNHAYAYDDADRLIKTDVADAPGASVRNSGYALDGVGNREVVSGSPDPGIYTMGATLCEPGDHQMNQYTTTPFDHRKHDPNGNLIDRSPTVPGARTMKYDFSNRMVEESSMAASVTTYAHDVFGRRIKKIADSGSAFPLVTEYFYRGWQVLEERDGVGATLATYVYGNYIDEILSMRRGKADYYYHADDLFNVMAVSNAAGVPVERYEYQDFGDPEFFDGTGAPISGSAIGNPYLFTGRRFDPETRLYYYRTRYLEPRSGRFTRRDTIGIWGDRVNLGNPLSYVGNNAWTWTDPASHETMDPFAPANCDDPSLDPLTAFFQCPPSIGVFDPWPPPGSQCDPVVSWCEGPMRKCREVCRHPITVREWDCGLCIPPLAGGIDLPVKYAPQQVAQLAGGTSGSDPQWIALKTQPAWMQAVGHLGVSSCACFYVCKPGGVDCTECFCDPTGCGTCD